MFDKILKSMCARIFYVEKFDLRGALEEMRLVQDKIQIVIEQLEADVIAAEERIEAFEKERDDEIAIAYNVCKAKVETEEELLSDLEDDISEAKQWLSMFPR